MNVKMIYVSEEIHTELLLLKINGKKRNIDAVIKDLLKQKKVNR